MRPLSLKISVPQPCAQSWDSMSPEGAGRFCGNCNKVVVDFTGLSDSQIVEILSDTSSRYCGRFNTTQLDRMLVAEKPAASLLPAVIITALLMTAGGVTTATPTNAIAIDTVQHVTGTVKDNSGNPLPGATVTLKGTAFKALTDSVGNYKLSVPPSLAGKDLILVFAFVGFDIQEMLVNAQYREGHMLKTELTSARTGLTEVVVCEPTRWQKLRHKSKKLWRWK
ncbi:carboxypeptidase-like regulatory domain-containing protein [Chitinophaga flava]|nr:carboxypeptidase-like regulatory domain-containing protein [Chitinophaga flava]